MKRYIRSATRDKISRIATRATRAIQYILCDNFFPSDESGHGTLDNIENVIDICLELPSNLNASNCMPAFKHALANIVSENRELFLSEAAELSAKMWASDMGSRLFLDYLSDTIDNGVSNATFNDICFNDVILSLYHYIQLERSNGLSDDQIRNKILEFNDDRDATYENDLLNDTRNSYWGKYFVPYTPSHLERAVKLSGNTWMDNDPFLW